VLVVAAVVQAVRRRPRPALALAGGMALLVATYMAVDVVVGVAASPPQLRPGDTLCFDDWCVSMTAAREDPAAGAVSVDLRIENHGRGRPQRSALARAYLEAPGGARIGPADGRVLSATLVSPGQRIPATLTFPVPASLRQTRFVVTEGDPGSIGPGLFEIGSAFRAPAGWPVSLTEG